ncbi:MAG: class I SAM-dependent methyltransferase [Anaerococcus sp.]|uniref:tRNA (adenine(22)-N(1))-methyltransferase n=1 Tax=Anaerococcus sp. TaxID=1872515 RepID=UPI00262321F3|nr:class I SAM-dependent methyltransferase [Anaerococcus sp.]MCI5972266.1 class I SAM-dependent methyltransferase [Anaerococcus sp.]MDD6918944.1 class I SAM-dependent methyltransferase [Peptoniphilaceae bacterium]MDY2927205.1 class I SAM-dependent methyltransferase [Anaerococcus sp.]
MEDKKRLLDIISLIDKNKKVIDIGTDHGLVPLYLAKNGISKEILATDISEKSLDKLRGVLDSDTEKIIKTKVTDGFKGINKDEGQVAIIAGMGANTIIDIIEESMDFAQNLDYMILASNINTEKLRLFLVENDFEIMNDFLSFENKKYYDIIKTRFAKASPLNLSETYYGRDDIENESQILKDKLKIDRKKNLKFREDILAKSKDKKSLGRIDEKLQAIEEIENIWKLKN